MRLYNQKQVQMPTITKVTTQEVGADVKESGLFPCASNQEDRGFISQSPSPHPSVCRGFHKKGEGKRTKRSREGVEKFSTFR